MLSDSTKLSVIFKYLVKKVFTSYEIKCNESGVSIEPIITFVDNTDGKESPIDLWHPINRL